MEKTFEELLTETPSVKNGLDDFFGKQTVLKLLQQVREATIAECKEKTRQAEYLADAYNLIGDLPTEPHHTLTPAKVAGKINKEL